MGMAMPNFDVDGWVLASNLADEYKQNEGSIARKWDFGKRCSKTCVKLVHCLGTIFVMRNEVHSL